MMQHTQGDIAGTPAPGDSPASPAQGHPVLVLGDGGWGTALAVALHAAGRAARIWCFDPSYAELIQRLRTNPKFLPEVRIPDEVQIGSDARALGKGVSLVLSVIPTQFLRSALESLAPSLPAGALFVSCSKGFERGTLSLPSRIIQEVLPGARVAVLSGPSHAEEVSRGLPTTVVAAAADLSGAERVQRTLGGPGFRIYTSEDPIGVEVGGASKNVIALAAGIADGLGFGDNARAGLITRGLHEMTRLGVALGGRAETFAGLSGMGDLIATATSTHSRNRAVGMRIARGESLSAILASTEKVAEGVETTRSIVGLGARLGVDLPITHAVHAVLFEGKSPREAVEDLMSRESKPERL